MPEQNSSNSKCREGLAGTWTLRQLLGLYPSAQLYVLSHPFPSPPFHPAPVCNPSLFCIAPHWKMQKKLEYSPLMGRHLGSKVLLQGVACYLKFFLKVLKRQLEWAWVPFVQRGNKAHLLWLYITSRVLHPCERAPNLEMGKLTRGRNSSSI